MLRKMTILAFTAALTFAGIATAQVKDPNAQPTGGSTSAPHGGLPGTTCSGAGGTNCMVGIPDSGGGDVSSTFTFAGCNGISDVNIGVQATHSWVGDLIFTVQSPGGTSVAVIDRPGVPASGAGCSGDNIDAILDDQAATPVEDECAMATPTIDGTFIPNNALSAFNGEDSNGTWMITVSDNASGDTGTLDDWSVEAVCGAAAFDSDPAPGFTVPFAIGQTGDVTGGSISITNGAAATTDLVVSNCALSGPDAAQFSIDSVPGPIAAGNLGVLGLSCTIDEMPITYTADLMCSTNDAAFPTVTWSLVCVGQPLAIPALNVWGIALFVLILGLMTVVVLRRRAQ